MVKNSDGSISTERSITIEEDGEYINIPTVIKGKIVSDEEAIEYYHNTNEHLGKFSSKKEALKAAESLHKKQEERYVKP